jgi:Fe-S-cluster containining protein
VSASLFTATLVDKNCVRENAFPGHCAVLDIQPESIGRLVGAQVVVTDAPAGLGDLVPLARVPEALHLGREIGSISGTCEATTAQALTVAAGRILEGWSESPFSQSATDDGVEDVCDIESVGRWYAALDLDCPFLREGLCTIYHIRPIACREHAVLDTAAYCDGFSPGRGNRLEMPVKVLDALAQTAAEMEQTQVQAVMMPLVPFWYEENRHREFRTWSGPELVSRFLDCLAETTSRGAFEASDAA